MHAEPGPLVMYNSLVDPHLANFYANKRRQRHLRRAGLITRDGEVVPEQVHRQLMQCRDKKRSMQEALSQMIIDKALDLEHNQQMLATQTIDDINRLERIMKLKAERSGHCCNEPTSAGIAPHSPIGKQRPISAKLTYQSGRRRPISAHAISAHNQPTGMHVTMWHRNRPISAQLSRSTTRSASAHLLRSRLQQVSLSRPPSGRVMGYDSCDEDFTLNRFRRSNSVGRPFDLESNSSTKYQWNKLDGPKDNKSEVIWLQGKPIPADQLPHMTSQPSTYTARRRRKEVDNRPKRAHSAKLRPVNTQQVHSTDSKEECVEVTMVYNGLNLELDYERTDPTDEIIIEQQHCGGNTLIVYRGKLQPHSQFCFTSQRHAGFPFSLTLYINGRKEGRVSACCEYKHRAGSTLGAKNGQFGIVGIKGGVACVKCSARGRKKRTRRSTKTITVQQNGPIVPVEDDANTADNKNGPRGIADDDDDYYTKQDTGLRIPVNDLSDDDTTVNYTDKQSVSGQNNRVTNRTNSNQKESETEYSDDYTEESGSDDNKK